MVGLIAYGVVIALTIIATALSAWRGQWAWVLLDAGLLPMLLLGAFIQYDGRRRKARK